MHELPITQAILDQVLKAASVNQVNRVTAINLSLGEYTGLVDESIQFYWDLIAKDTIASNATIKITRVFGEVKCLACDQQLTKSEKPDLCPACGSHRLVIIGGDQLELTSIETE